MVHLYKAVLPDPVASTYSSRVALFVVLARKIHLLTPETGIAEIMADIEQIMDSSVATKGYIIREANEPYSTASQIDLSQIDFDALRTHFERAHKHTEAEKLRGSLNSKLKRMVQLNKSRIDYLEKFQRLIDEYNAGSANVEIFFIEFLVLTQELNKEEQRTIAEHLTEEELAVFDLLTRPHMELSEKEKDTVKKVARDLLATLKREKLVLDWRKKQQARAAVRTSVQTILDELPRIYTTELYQQKCDEVYQHIYDSYYGQGQSIYEAVS